MRKQFLFAHSYANFPKHRAVQLYTDMEVQIYVNTYVCYQLQLFENKPKNNLAKGRRMVKSPEACQSLVNDVIFIIQHQMALSTIRKLFQSGQK